MLCIHFENCHFFIKPPDILCVSVVCSWWKCLTCCSRHINFVCVCVTLNCSWWCTDGWVYMYVCTSPWTCICLCLSCWKRASKTLKITLGSQSRSFGCSEWWGWWSSCLGERAFGHYSGPSLNPFRWEEWMCNCTVVQTLCPKSSFASN